MQKWQPATVDEVNQIVARDLKACDAEQVEAFKTYQVRAFTAPILRYGKMESVVVVARNGDRVIYYEDVEGGFNVSPVSPEGILQHYCDQNELGLALNAWIKGQDLPRKLAPTVPVNE